MAKETPRPARRSDPAAPAGDKAAQDGGGVLPRLSIPTTRDGARIAVDRMQDSVREKLKKVLDDPELPAALGLTRSPAPVAAPKEDEYPASFVEQLYDWIGGGMALAAKQRGFTKTQASVLEFTPKEVADLTPMTRRLLYKYFPAGLGAYTDEIMLTFTVGGLIAGKIQALNDSTRKPAEVVNIAGGTTTAPDVNT